MTMRRGKSNKKNGSWKVKIPVITTKIQPGAVLDTDKIALTLSPPKIRRTNASLPSPPPNPTSQPPALLLRLRGSSDTTRTNNDDVDLYSLDVTPTDAYNIEASVYQTQERLQGFVGRYEQAQLEAEARKEDLLRHADTASEGEAEMPRNIRALPHQTVTFDCPPGRGNAQKRGATASEISQEAWWRTEEDQTGQTIVTVKEVETSTKQTPEENEVSRKRKSPRVVLLLNGKRPKSAGAKPPPRIEVHVPSWAEQHGARFREFWLAQEATYKPPRRNVES